MDVVIILDTQVCHQLIIKGHAMFMLIFILKKRRDLLGREQRTSYDYSSHACSSTAHATCTKYVRTGMSAAVDDIQEYV